MPESFISSYYDTDIDFIILTGGSKTTRYDFNFSRNITSNLETHGEFTYINNFEKKHINSSGDLFNNEFDAKSYLLGTRYLTERDTTYISIPFGVATVLVVIAHEVPQEIGDFGVLLESGYSKKKALIYNLLSSVSTLPGAMIAYFYLKTSQILIPYILALSAASFIYIAIADLIPTLHKRVGPVASIRQFILILAGIGTILFFRMHHCL